jgi:GMP synthase (glutamine-hydrolysing)
MSHADHISQMPIDFEQIAHSQNSIAAIKHLYKEIYGIQFHLEVTHTEYGTQILKNFLFEIVKVEQD